MTTSRKFGNLYKGPTHVAIDITSQCNMKCLHCYNRSGGLAWENMDLNEATWLRFSKEIRRLEPCSFCFCGGEPLIRFGLVIAMLKRIRNSITQIGLVSNGFLLTEEKAECLVQNGLGLLQISLDGAQAETHDRLRGVDGCHVRALNAIKIAHKAGVENLVVAFSPTCFNIPEFSCLVKKLSDVGVGKIRVQPLMGLGNGCLNRNIFPTEQQYHLLHDTILDLSATYNSVKIEWGDPVDHLLRNVELISEFVPYVSVRSNGDITLSPYLVSAQQFKNALFHCVQCASLV